MTHNNVARHITCIIRDYIGKDVPKHVTNSLSSRSLKKGGIIDLAAHQSICYPEEHAILGQSTGNNLDKYIENIGIVLSKYASMDLKSTRMSTQTYIYQTLQQLVSTKFNM